MTQSRTLLLTLAALIAFAANSVLGRLGLSDGTTDPGTFTSIRLASGALMLWLLVRLPMIRRQHSPLSPISDWLFPTRSGGLISALMLFVYAAGFSYAYVDLDTGTGALILFGCVQLTIIGYSLYGGHRPNTLEWLGILLAFGGFVYLVLPQVGSPTATGLLLMSVAGIAWGVYTLKGKGSKSPIQDTARNFVGTLPFVAGLMLVVAANQPSVSVSGALLATASGAITSALGYTLWYLALAGLTTIQASVIQLSVPVLATVGGIIFSNESLTLQLTLASVMILGGIGLTLKAKR